MYRSLLMRFIAIIIATCLFIFIEYKFEIIDYLRFPNAAKTFEVNSASDFIAYSPDGKMFAVAGGKQIRAKISFNTNVNGYTQVQVRRSQDGSLIKSLDFFSAQSLAFSPDSSMIAAGNRQGKLSVWQISDGELVHSVEREIKFFSIVKSLAFTPTGNNLVEFTLSKNRLDYTIKIWNLNDKTSRQISVDYLYGALSPDGKTIALVRRDKTINLYRFNDLTFIKKLDVVRPPSSDLKFSPDSKKIAFFSSLPLELNKPHTRSTYIYSIEDGSLLNTFYYLPIFFMTKENPKDIAISPDGRYLAVSYRRSAPSSFFVGAPRPSKARFYGRIRVWRIEDGKQLQTLRGHKYRTDNVVFMPDSQLLTSTGADGKVRIWKMPPRNYSRFWIFGGICFAALVYWQRTSLINWISR